MPKTSRTLVVVVLLLLALGVVMLASTSSVRGTANFDDPQESLDLLPHQIMHSLAMGLTDRVLGSRMIWDCATCYLCQELCPQGVRVTEILYELKNRAYRRHRAASPAGEPDRIAPPPDCRCAEVGKTGRFRF